MTTTHTDAALTSLRGATEFGSNELLGPFLDAAWAITRGSIALQGDELAAFLAATAPRVADAWRPLSRYVSCLETLLMSEFWGREWEQACEQRSRIEAVRTLWRDAGDLSWDLAMPIDDLDHMMRGKGAREGGPDLFPIPPGTPTCHWWWWLPGEPPAS